MISLAFDGDGYSQRFLAPWMDEITPSFEFVVRRYRQGYILQNMNGAALTSPLSQSGAISAVESLISRDGKR